MGNKGYVALGGSAELWGFDPATGTWAQRANYSGTGRSNASALVIGSTAYLGLGSGGSAYCNDWWSYDPTANT